MDDLKSIFLANRPLDLRYLSGQMQKLALVVPKPIQEFTPKALNLVFKKMWNRRFESVPITSV